MEAYFECLKAIRFEGLKLKYRAIQEGYVAGNPFRKLRATLKSMVQGVSPCLDQRQNNCKTCRHSSGCLYEKLFVEYGGRDYLPYVLSPTERQSWTGKIQEGSLHEVMLILVGDRIPLIPEIAAVIGLKKEISFKGVNGTRTSFVLEAISVCGHAIPDYAVGATDQIGQFEEANHPPEELTLEFITPLSLFYHNKTITEPSEVSFEIFQEVLLKRICGLARSYCGYGGQAPSLPVGSEVETILYDDFRFTNPKARKQMPNGRIQEQYIGGFKGRLTFRGYLSPLLPLLYLGEVLHVGSDTTQGLGKYKILLPGRLCWPG